MSSIDIDKVMKEIEKLQTKNDEEKALNELRSRDTFLVENAIKAVAYMDTLNEKQKEYFEFLQRKRPSVALAIVSMQNDEVLSDQQIETLLHEANDDSASLISSKQIRFNLAQETILNYLASKEHKSMASYVRDLLLEKMKASLKGEH